jgi:hypothetical protein
VLLAKACCGKVVDFADNNILQVWSFLGYSPLLNRGIRLSTMANLIITYWRDIPSQVAVKLGRKEEKRMLDNRFMEAIDMAAMRGGATDTDAYLADWRRADAIPVGDDLVSEVEKAKSDIEAAYDKDRLKTLIANGGKLSS